MSNCFVAPTVVVDLPVQYTFCATLESSFKIIAYKLVSRDVINVQLFVADLQ